MENLEIMVPVKRTVHKTSVTMVRDSRLSGKSPKRVSPDGNSFVVGARVVRISMTDPYATDSSGDEDKEAFCRRRVRKFVKEVKIEARLKDDRTVDRNRKLNKTVGTVGKRLKVSSGKKFRGPDALTNFTILPSPEKKPSPVFSGNESNETTTSPKSVLCFPSDESAAESTHKSFSSHIAGGPNSLTDFRPSDDYFSASDLFDFPKLDPCIIEDCDPSDVFLRSGNDFNVESSSSSSSPWPTGDHLHEYGDVFRSDSLVALQSGFSV